MMSHQTHTPRVPASETSLFATLLPPRQQWFTPREAAELLGCSNQYIRECLEDQRILGYMVRKPRGLSRTGRANYRIHRDGLLLYLLESANHTTADYAERLQELLQRCPPDILPRLQSAVSRAEHVTTKRIH